MPSLVEYDYEDMAREEINPTYRKGDYVIVCRKNMSVPLGAVLFVEEMPEDTVNYGPVLRTKDGVRIVGYRTGCYTLYKKGTYKKQYKDFSWDSA